MVWWYFFIDKTKISDLHFDVAVCTYSVHCMVGLELGPTRGASLGVFFFLGCVTPCFLSLASAAAARSARILARSSGVKLGSTAAGGRSSFLLAAAVLVVALSR